MQVTKYALADGQILVVLSNKMNNKVHFLIKKSEQGEFNPVSAQFESAIFNNARGEVREF